MEHSKGSVDAVVAGWPRVMGAPPSPALAEQQIPSLGGREGGVHGQRASDRCLGTRGRGEVRAWGRGAEASGSSCRRTSGAKSKLASVAVRNTGGV